MAWPPPDPVPGAAPEPNPPLPAELLAGAGFAAEDPAGEVGAGGAEGDDPASAGLDDAGLEAGCPVPDLAGVLVA